MRDAGVEVTEVADVTGFPECLDGRVKTLHPTSTRGSSPTGTSSRRTSPARGAGHRADRPGGRQPLPVPGHGRFRRGAADDVVEMIDIGGPTMVRAAAKNHGSVGHPRRSRDYDERLAADHRAGRLTAGLRASSRAPRSATPPPTTRPSRPGSSGTSRCPNSCRSRSRGSPCCGTARTRTRQRRSTRPRARRWVAGGPAAARQGAVVQQPAGHRRGLGHGADVDRSVRGDHQAHQPGRLRDRADLADAYERALEGDPVSAFGGIVASNRPIDAATAEQIIEVFTEVVIAPGFDGRGARDPPDQGQPRILRCPGVAATHWRAQRDRRAAGPGRRRRRRAVGRVAGGHHVARRGDVRRPAVRVDWRASTPSPTRSCSRRTGRSSGSVPGR
jgi:phosphoribosylaminoimidazolecarboxamide formyltransferase / IMP cyclohydrolase